MRTSSLARAPSRTGTPTMMRLEASHWVSRLLRRTGDTQRMGSGGWIVVVEGGTGLVGGTGLIGGTGLVGGDDGGAADETTFADCDATDGDEIVCI